MKISSFLLLCFLGALSVEASDLSDEATPVLTWIFEQPRESELKALLALNEKVMVLGLSKHPLVYEIGTKELTESELSFEEFIQAHDLQADLKSLKSRWLIVRLHKIPDETKNKYQADIGLSDCHGRFGRIIQNPATLEIGDKSRLTVKCCF